MSEQFKERLRAAMKEAGLNPRSLSLAAGLNQTAVRDILSGRSKNPLYGTVKKLADALGVLPEDLMQDPADLDAALDAERREKIAKDQALQSALQQIERAFGKGSVQRIKERPSAASDVDLSQRMPVPRGERDLPVYGTAVGGNDAMFEMNGTVHDYVNRPPSLDGVTAAYAVYISGESMEPRYFAGETIFVHPGRPITPSCFVVVQFRPEEPGAPPKAIVKQFLRKTGHKLFLRQFNPRKEMDFPMDKILTIHRIVLGGED